MVIPFDPLVLLLWLHLKVIIRNKENVLCRKKKFIYKNLEETVILTNKGSSGWVNYSTCPQLWL